MWETRASAEKLYQYYIGLEHYDVEIGFFRGLPTKIISGGSKNRVRHILHGYIVILEKLTAIRVILEQWMMFTRHIKQWMK